MTEENQIGGEDSAVYDITLSDIDNNLGNNMQ